MTEQLPPGELLILGRVLAPPVLDDDLGGAAPPDVAPPDLAERATAWEPPTVTLPDLDEMCEPAEAGDRPPRRGLLHTIMVIVYQLAFLDLWRRLEGIGQARLCSAAGQDDGSLLTMHGGATQWGPLMTDEQWGVAVRRLLGAHEAYCEGARACPACGTALSMPEIAAVHFCACLGATGGRWSHGGQTAHAALKRAMGRILQDAGCRPVYETPGLLGSATAERPGDVVVLDYVESNRHLVVDVSCTRIMSASYINGEIRAPGCTVESAEEAKRRLYGERCKARGVTFVPFVTDEYGHLGAHGQAFLIGLARRTAQRRAANSLAQRTAGIGTRVAELLGRWRGIVSMELHIAMARTLMSMADFAHRTPPNTSNTT
jgi:hypothetical protein